MSGAEFTRFPGGGGPPGNKAGEATAPPTFVVCPRCKGSGQRSTAFGDIGIDPCVPCSGSGTVPRPTITDPTISCENNTGHGADGGVEVPRPTIPGGATRKPRAPMGGFLLFTLMGASLLGCGPRKVLTSINKWEHWNARYPEECQISTPACDCKWEALARWDKLLHEAGEAVKRGGGMKLQLKALKTSEAAYGACK